MDKKTLERYSLEELLGYSIEAEKNATGYYNDFSEAAIGRLMKERFKNLARDEKIHAKELLKIYKKEFGDKDYVVPSGDELPSHETEFKFDDVKNMVDSLEKAITNERNAKKIYLYMAEKWDKYSTEFRYIAMMEEGHAKSLRAEMNLFEGEAQGKSQGKPVVMEEVWQNVRDRDRID